MFKENLRIMSWRSHYSAPPTPAVKKSTQTVKEPAWVSVLPSAKGLWSMIVTFRERGSNEIADNLEAAAEKQAEVHLKTQELMMNKRTGLRHEPPPPTIRLPRDVVEPVRRIKSRSSTPTHTPTINTTNINMGDMETSQRDSQYSQHSESDDLDGDTAQEKSNCGEQEEQRSTRTKHRLPSVRLEPASPLSSCTVSPRSRSPVSPPGSTPSSPTCPTPGDLYLAAPPPLAPIKPHACYHSRLKTYERSKFRWVSPSPSELSEAGFYFIGPRDNVQCFSCDTAQNYWKPAEDPWVRHGRRSPSCDYVIETRGLDFISAIINKVEKVKTGLKNSYSRSNSNSSLKGTDSELTNMKLRETKTASSSGWRLDPYKERGVGAVPAKSTAKRKKKS